MKIKLITTLTVLCVLQLTVKAQTVDSVLKQYGEQFKQERLYFHFDKSAYFPGDTIWYKVYITSGWDTSGISKNIYTDWSDAHGNILLHGADPIILSSSYGQMVIPGDYTGNVFHLRAYTSWMLNFDTAFLYDKDLLVIQPKSQLPSNKAKPTVQVTLFPEGGYLVQNLMCAVAFKAENTAGRAVNITGALKNKKGEVLDSLSCVHDGMGKFFITPEVGDAYSVSWKDDEGDSGIAPMPAALATGVTLKASPSKTKVSYHIERAADAPDDLKTLHLVATVWQQEVYKSTINLTAAASATNFIPSSQFPSGILTVTLFSASWKPVAERIVFVNNNDYSFTTAISAKGNMAKRGRNEIEINVPDSIQGNLSIAVTDAGLLNDNSENIISNLLLKSEIKGRVNNPAYYFSSQEDSVKDALDLVMLTNGWRRYKWDDVVAGRLPKLSYIKDSSYINVFGKAILKGNNPVDTTALLSVNLRGTYAADSLSDVMVKSLNGDGSFQLDPGPFHDSMFVYYKFQSSNKKNDRKTFVNFTSSLLKNAASPYGGKLFYTAQEDSLAVLQNLALKAKQDELLRLMQTTTLKDVVVKTKTKTKAEILDESFTSPNFSGFGNVETIDVVNDPGAKGIYTLSNYLTDKIPSLEQKTSGTPPVPIYYYRPKLNMQGQWTGRVTVYLDEMLTDEETLQGTPVDQIAYVKLFRNGALALADNNPTLVVYTRKGGGGE